MIVINAGIGDMILSRALLDSHGESLDIALDLDALSFYRSQEWVGFAEALFARLFVEPMYHRVEKPRSFGWTPQQVSAALRVAPVVPDLRNALTDGDRQTGRGHVVVTTKIRGWQRREYEAMRPQFVEAVRNIAAVRPIALVGERQVGCTTEYMAHGKDLVYSIYNDIAEFAAADHTVSELGTTPPEWGRFLADCDIMQNADAVITLGTGGNVSMAMACGSARVYTLPLVGTEMASYFCWARPQPRVLFCGSEWSYMECLRGLAK